MGAPKGNKNAEKWTLKEATSFYEEALEMSKNKDYDFLGEIARDLGQYIDLFDHLTSRFPELKETKKKIMSNCQANCYSNGKNGDIVPSLAIMNLKSNHGWTDRVQSENVNHNNNSDIPLTKEEIEARKKQINERY